MKITKHLLLGVVALVLTTASYAMSQGHMHHMQHEQKSVAAVPADSVAAAKVEYRCPMDPDVVSDTPGKCPKCGMALKKGTNQQASSDLMEHTAKGKAGAAPSNPKGGDSVNVQQHNHDNM